MKKKKLSIGVSDSIGRVSAEVLEPARMRAMLVLAHGAGADMNHRFMTSLAAELADRDVGTIRFNFPFTENHKGRPDPPAIAEKTVERVIQRAREQYPNVPLFSGGKSFGGRMTSQLLSKNVPDFLLGIVFFGFPLHAPGKPSTDRAEHLKSVNLPMLFLQGTRDALAQLNLIESVTGGLKKTTLLTFEGADHSFKAGKKEFIPELAASTAGWLFKVSK